MSDREEERIYRDVVLSCGDKGKAYFTLSLPKEIPSEGLKCVVIVGGLETGRESLSLIPDHGNYALIGYEYPQTLQHLHTLSLLWHLPSIRREVLNVPYQMLAMIQYLEREKWMKESPISLMGCSFGSTFIPVTYVIAHQKKIQLGPGVMAYGGAGIKCLIQANFPGPRWIRKLAGLSGKKLFKPIDPLNYASKMKGNFLMINGIYDTQIPFCCAQCLHSLVPNPKTVITLETSHLHPEDRELIVEIIQLSRKWLNEN